LNDPNTGFGTLVAPDTLRLQRSLPGPIERVWHYLTDSDARGQWLARGRMDLRIGGEVDLEFRHDTLPGQHGPTPERFRTGDGGHHQPGRITACEPPRLLAHTWGEAHGMPSEVRYELEPHGDRVLLTITHRRLVGHDTLVSVASGWHAHAGILVDLLAHRAPADFWIAYEALEAEYARRLPRATA
jgi:uncharacterized protein YndB with AHSA1/START domain